jgi:membrane protease subunit HflK
VRTLAGVVLVCYLLTGLAVVGPDERAVVRRFGRVVARPGPGLWVGLPWGVDAVDRLPVRAVRQLAVGTTGDGEQAGLFLTGDQNLVAVGLVVEFAIDDADLDAHLLNRAAVDAAVGRQAEAVMAEWLAGVGVDDALLTGRAALAAAVFRELPGRLAPHRLGVVVQRVSVEGLAAPAEVREAFDAVTRAQAGVVTAENQATQQATRRLQEAETVRFRSEQQAAADRAAKRAAAAADAAAFLARLAAYQEARRADPDALAGLWWAEMGKTLLSLRANGRVDLLDHHLGPTGLDATQVLTPKR